MTRDRFSRTLSLWPVHGGMCTCGQTDSQGNPCRRAGKHPKWYEDGTEDEADGYVVVTGASPEGSGVFVLDVDVKGGTDGYAQLEMLCASDGGELPKTLTVRTPSGGAHFYFRHPGFHVGQHKPASAIDIKGDKRESDGLVYVVGPGSPGASGGTYEIVADAAIADAPEWLLAWLRIGAGNRARAADAFTPCSIDDTHPAWKERVDAGAEACRTMPPSKADGEGGKALFAVCLKLVRTLELPVGVALEQIKEWFNPRCTDPAGNVYPWTDEEILHKLEDARDRSAMPCGPPPLELRDVIAKHAQVPALRDIPAVPSTVARRVADPSHKYTYEIGKLAAHAEPGKIAFNDLVGLFANHPEWEGVLQFDEFADQIVCVNPPLRLDAESVGLTPGDLSDLRAYLEHLGVLAPELEISKALACAARMRRFHPVREYLEGLPAGDPLFLDGMALRLFGDTQAQCEEMLRKFLVAAVRRVMTPGCQVDSILILHGPKQGEGKTTFVEALFTEKWMRRGLPPDLSGRDASHALLGFWGVELGELASLLRTEKNAAKDFISWREDNYRQYGNGERIKKPRQCVFVGTTNDDDFLRDATGNRRYWPISVPEGHTIPVAWVREHRDQIWSAALALARDATYRHWFTREEEEGLHALRTRFIETDPWHDAIREYVKGRATVKSMDVYVRACGGELSKMSRKELLRVTDTLRRLGCRSAVRDSSKVWLVPDELSGEQPSPEEAARRKLHGRVQN